MIPTGLERWYFDPHPIADEYYEDSALVEGAEYQDSYLTVRTHLPRSKIIDDTLIRAILPPLPSKDILFREVTNLLRRKIKGLVTMIHPCIFHLARSCAALATSSPERERSLNHRFCTTSFKLPRQTRFHPHTYLCLLICHTDWLTCS